MPELAAIGAVGAIVTFLLANFNLYIVHRSFTDSKIKNLNLNLGKLGWYWSIDQGVLLKVETNDLNALLEVDYQKATRSAFIFGTMMIFLSWLGLIVLSVYMLSVYKIAKSNVEKRVMESALVRAEIWDLNEIQNVINQTTVS